MTTENTKCELLPCGNEAFADVLWSGELPEQKATLCRMHSDELWDKFKGHIAMGLMNYRIGKPGEFKESEK